MEERPTIAIEASVTDIEPLDLAELDRERHEQDRAIRRGYDFDCSAPSHAEFLQRTGRHCVCQTSPAEQEERELDRLARADGWNLQTDFPQRGAA